MFQRERHVVGVDSLHLSTIADWRGNDSTSAEFFTHLMPKFLLFMCSHSGIYLIRHEEDLGLHLRIELTKAVNDLDEGTGRGQ